MGKRSNNFSNGSASSTWSQNRRNAKLTEKQARKSKKGQALSGKKGKADEEDTRTPPEAWADAVESIESEGGGGLVLMTARGACPFLERTSAWKINRDFGTAMFSTANALPP